MEAVRVFREIIDVENFLREIHEVERKHGVRIMPVNGDVVFGEDQLRGAVMHAERNFLTGRNSARDFKTEVMRYIACERQIRSALIRAGIKEGTEKFVLLILGAGFDSGEILRDLGLSGDGFIKEERDKVDGALEAMALLDL